MPSASNPRALSLMHSSICSAVPHCSVPALGAAGSTAVGVGPTSFGVLGFAATTEMKEKKKKEEKNGCSSGVPLWKAGMNGTKQCSSIEVGVLQWLTATGRAKPAQRSSRVCSNGTKQPFSPYLGLSDGGTPSWLHLHCSSVSAQ